MGPTSCSVMADHPTVEGLSSVYTMTPPGRTGRSGVGESGVDQLPHGRPMSRGRMLVSGSREDRCMNSGPPQIWREHWFEHDQVLNLAGATGHVAVYFDPDGNEDAARWLLPYLDDAWQYTKHTYGVFGPDPLLYSIFHDGRYSGGHPSSYQDASHDYRNVTDCGPGPYRAGDRGIHDMVTHEISHVVEGANN